MRSILKAMLGGGLLVAALSSGAALAKRVAPVGPVPVGNPGEWIATSDYPAIATLNLLEGTTAFRLAVDQTGKPTGCEVVTSSRFDVLDDATCELLLRRARFVPGRDAAGKPVAGSFASRVRWVVPEGGTTFRPMRAVMRLMIDRRGAVGSCAVIAGSIPPGEDGPCRALQGLPVEIAMAMRGKSSDETNTVDIELARDFGPVPPAAWRTPAVGFDQIGFTESRVVLNADGSPGECRIDEQRGDGKLIENFCASMTRLKFDPPFDSLDQAGHTNAWAMSRILVKIAP